MLDITQLVDNAARAMMRAEGDDPSLMWGRRFAGLMEVIAARSGGLLAATDLLGASLEKIDTSS